MHLACVSPRFSARKSLVVFRHGETDLNRKGIIQGRTNAPLNETGMQQARDLAQRLRVYPIQAILTSPMSRAKKTAEIVQEHIRVPLYYEELLVEANCGIHEGRTKDVDFFREWESPLNPDLKPENGETNREIFQRAIEGMRNFMRTNPEHDYIAVSTHGGVIRRLINFLRLGAGSDPSHQSIALVNGTELLGEKPCDAHIPNTFFMHLSYDGETDRFELVG